MSGDHNAHQKKQGDIDAVESLDSDEELLSKALAALELCDPERVESILNAFKERLA